jgi:uncharacterized membrane protein
VQLRGYFFEELSRYTLYMTQFIFSYIVAVPLFFTIDIIWLGIVAKNFYRRELGEFLAPVFNWPAAILFYLLFIAGIVFFAVFPALQEGKSMVALFYGMLFGFLAYATYDLTNLATLKNWPLSVTVVDMVWGAIISGVVAYCTYSIVSRFFGYLL